MSIDGLTDVNTMKSRDLTGLDSKSLSNPDDGPKRYKITDLFDAENIQLKPYPGQGKRSYAQRNTNLVRSQAPEIDIKGRTRENILLDLSSNEIFSSDVSNLDRNN